MELFELEIYKIALQLSDNAWEIYNKMNKNEQIIIGSQFITAINSIGANIAEGYGRFHYLDKNKFMYNARGSLMENIFWIEQLNKRCVITDDVFKSLSEKLNDELYKLNAFIAVTKRQATQ